MAADTTTEKFKTLEERVKALNNPDADGSLTIKISKRDQISAGGIFRPALVCTMNGASISHVVNSETWLPRLMGGGRYILAVYPPGMSAAPLVDGLEVDLSGESKSYPDFEAVESSDWAGPKGIIYPTKRAVQQASTPLSIVSPPGASTPPLATSAPQTQTSPGMGGSIPGAAHQEELRRIQDFYTAKIDALNQRLAEEQHRREMDELKAAHQRQMEAMRVEVKDLAAKITIPPPVVAPPSPSLGDSLKEILPVLVPIFTTYMQSSAERDRRAEERQAEVLKALSSRPVIPPEIKELMEIQRAEQLPVTTILQSTAQSTAAMATQMLAMAREVAEMQSGPEESAAVKAIREVGNAVQGIVSASAASANVPRPRRLPKDVQAIDAPPPQASGAEMTQAMGDAAPPHGVLARIKEMLLAHEDPEKVAQECVKAFPTPEFQKALVEAGLEPRKMFQTLMTDEWLAANLQYVTAFGHAFTRHGQVAGIFEKEREEEEDDDNEAA